MKTLINDSAEFQAALIYPERARPKCGVSPRWRTAAIVGWITVGILTALRARGADDFAGRGDLALQPTAPLSRALRPANFSLITDSLITFPHPAPVPGVSPATENDLAGGWPIFADRAAPGLSALRLNFGGVVPALAGPPTGVLFPDSSGQRL